MAKAKKEHEQEATSLVEVQNTSRQVLWSEDGPIPVGTRAKVSERTADLFVRLKVAKRGPFDVSVPPAAERSRWTPVRYRDWIAKADARECRAALADETRDAFRELLEMRLLELDVDSVEAAAG